MTALGSTTLALANPGTHLPGYARENVTVGMIHIGVGGFHRAHQAVYLDALLSEDESARSFGICGACRTRRLEVGTGDAGSTSSASARDTWVPSEVIKPLRRTLGERNDLVTCSLGQGLGSR